MIKKGRQKQTKLQETRQLEYKNRNYRQILPSPPFVLGLPLTQPLISLLSTSFLPPPLSSSIPRLSNSLQCLLEPRLTSILSRKSQKIAKIRELHALKPPFPTMYKQRREDLQACS